MGKMLNAVIEVYTKPLKDENGQSVDYCLAQKALEAEIVKEICEEKAEEIDCKAAELAEAREFSRIINELKMLVIQCGLLALVVGVLGTHIFEMLYAGCYLVDGHLDGTRLGIGFFTLFLIGVALIVWIFFSKLSELINPLIGRKERRGK